MENNVFIGSIRGNVNVSLLTRDKNSLSCKFKNHDILKLETFHAGGMYRC